MPKEWRAGNATTLVTTRGEIEEQTTHRFEDLLSAEGISLGPRDRGDRNELRVDFVFEQNKSGTALEITRLVDVDVVELSSLLLQMEQRLTRLAEAEHLGWWMLAIREGSTINTLEPAIEAFLREHRNDSDARFAVPGSTLDADPLSDELVQLGFVIAAKLPGADAVQISPQISDRPPAALGFSDLLAQCVSNKDAALRQARPRTTHLAVVVEDMRFTADPQLSPPPELTDAIDFLWVFLSDFLEPRNGSRVWRVQRGNDAWQLLWVRDGFDGSILLSPPQN